MRAAQAAPEIERVASIIERLATLLEAGVAPSAAWTYLAEFSEDRVVGAVGRGVAASEGVLGALQRSVVDMPVRRATPWRALAAAWSVAEESGAPLAGGLRALATSFRDLGQTERDIEVALAGPAATARLVMWLPPVGLAFGSALGFDTVGTLLGSPGGWATLVSGLALLVAGSQWNRRLVRRAHEREQTPGLTLDLLAVALSGGGSAASAERVVAAVTKRFLHPGHAGSPNARNERHDQSAQGAQGVLRLSARAGVPAGDLLRSEAQQHRRDARTAGQREAAALAVRLMIPLGVCILPSFLLLGVAPMLLAIVSSTFAGELTL